jgi:hypothetical protein
MFFLLIVSAALASLVILGRRLPVQNVVTISTIVLGVSGLLELVNARTGIPFGKVIFRDSFGGKIFGVLPWTMPLLWLIAILNGRGSAQLILRPWRTGKNYGWWLLGLGALLTTILLFDFHIYAKEIRHYFGIDRKSENSVGLVFITRFAATLLLLLLTTGWFINKKPVEEKLHFYPLILWGLTNSYFAIAAFIHHSFTTATLMFLAIGAVTFFAIAPSLHQRLP